MQVEELLKMLQDAGMEEEAIKMLLSDALASLDGPAEEEAPADEDAEQAGKLLGVEF